MTRVTEALSGFPLATVRAAVWSAVGAGPTYVTSTAQDAPGRRISAEHRSLTMVNGADDGVLVRVTDRAPDDARRSVFVAVTVTDPPGASAIRGDVGLAVNHDAGPACTGPAIAATTRAVVPATTKGCRRNARMID